MQQLDPQQSAGFGGAAAGVIENVSMAQ